MNRVAVFVDAGYLFAQGSKALTGANRKRTDLSLDPQKTINALSELSKSLSPESELLRVYWYDGVQGYKGPSLQHEELAYLDNVKLRLGFINSFGQQKGVDSLIVIDMIDLARNCAIKDAVLVSGDEDVRVGVQVAQTFGVRVHLLGISEKDKNDASQSNQLVQESDTVTIWKKENIEKFLTVKERPTVDAPKEVEKHQGKKEVLPTITEVVNLYIKTLPIEDLTSLSDSISENKGRIPPEYDAPLLGKCRDAISSTLSIAETRSMRTIFKSAIETKLKE